VTRAVAFPAHDGQPVDVLVFAAHPDDAELGCAGTILRQTDAGRRVAVVDATRGEAGSRGTPETRAAEAAEATALLGLCARENLGLPDTAIAVTDSSVCAVVRMLRRYRPRVLLTHAKPDVHPDHVSVADLVTKAYFLAGLRHFDASSGLDPHRPRLVARFLGNDAVPAGFCVDISALQDRKREIVSCFASQIPATSEDRAHFVRGLDPIQRVEARDRWFGMQSGVVAAEPFALDGPASLDELAFLIPS
jgi:bacillithiol biosynthesis deacetylase BshB1